MILSLTAPTDTAGAAIKELGLRVLDANGNMRPMNDIFNDLNGILSTMTQGEQTQVLNKIFNKVDLKSVNALLANSGERFDELSGYIANCDGAAANMAETMNDNLQGKMTILGSTLEGLGIQIYERLEGPLKTAADTAVESLNNIAASLGSGELGSSIDSLAEAFGEMITKIAEGVENWLPRIITALTWLLENSNTIAAGVIAIGTAMLTLNVVKIIEELISAFKGVKTATEAWKVAQQLLNLTIFASPLGLFIGLIAGLAAGIIYLWNTNEGFRKAIIKCWNAILDAGKACWEWLVKFFTVDIPNAWNSVLKFFGSAGKWFVKVWKNIEQAFINGWNSIVSFFTSTIPKWLQDIKQKFIDGWQSIYNFFVNTIPTWIENISQWFSELPGKIWTWLVECYNKISQWGQDIWNKAVEIGTTFISSIIQFFNELPYKIGYVLGYVLGTIVQWGINIWSYLVTNVPIWIDTVVKFFSELPEKIWTWLVNTYNNIVKWGTDTWNNFITTCTNIINSVTEFFSKLPGIIWDWISDAYNKIVTWGKDIYKKAVEIGSNFLNSIINFFSQLPGKVWTWISNVYNNVVSWGSNMFSKAIEIGSNFITSIITWIQQLPGKIWTWLTETIGKVGQFASDLGKKAQEAGKEMFDNIVDAVKDLPGKMLSIGGDIVKGVWDGITGMGSWLKEKVSNFFGGIVAGAKKALKICSPSKVFRDEVGKYMAQGVGVGFENETKNVEKSMKDDFEYLVAKMQATVNYETSMTTSRVAGKVNSTNDSKVNSNSGISEGSVFILKNEIDGQSVGEATYKVVNNKLALAGRSIR